MNQQLRARLSIIAASVLWSSSGAALKSSQLNGWQLSAGRSLVAAAFLFAVFPRARRWPTKGVALVSAAYAGTVVLYVLANKLTTAANAIFLQDTAPLYVLLLSPFILGEKPSRGELLAAPVFLLGLSLFFVDQLSPGQLRGNLVALASGVCFSLMIMGLRKLGTSGEGGVAWGSLLAGLVSLPFAFSGPTPTPLDWGIIAFLGVFQLGLAYALFTRGMTHTPAVEGSLLILLEPVLNPIWTYLVAGERPGRWAIVGGVIILFATLWRTLQPVAKPPPESATPSTP